MANYECAVRTNYFHVKDAGRFREFMKNVCGSEDKIDLWAVTAELPDSKIQMEKLIMIHLINLLQGFRNISGTMMRLFYLRQEMKN